MSSSFRSRNVGGIFFFSFILNVGTVGIESMLVSLPRNGISGVLGGGGGRIGR